MKNFIKNLYNLNNCRKWSELIKKKVISSQFNLHSTISGQWHPTNSQARVLNLPYNSIYRVKAGQDSNIYWGEAFWEEFTNR
jgi:hypothetical protein